MAASSQLASVKDVDIDSSGRFKYILIKVYLKSEPKDFKYIVRGYGRCGFHGDIMDDVEPGITQNGCGPLKCECLGGGRIVHDPKHKTLEVFGYSQGYGKADHEISVKVLQKQYADYKITWSNDGY